MYRKHHFAFKLALCLWLLVVGKTMANSIERTLTTRLQVARANPILVLGGFSNIGSSTGRMETFETSDLKDDRQQAAGWSVYPWRIEAGSGDQIGLAVRVVVVPDAKRPHDAAKLLEKLDLEIGVYDTERIDISNKMNIKRLAYTQLNHTSYTKVQLKNGATFRVKHIAFETQLVFPKRLDIEITNQNTDYRFKTPLHHARIDIEDGVVEMVGCDQLDIRLKDATVKIDSVRNLKINALRSKAYLDYAQKVTLGAEAVFEESDLFSDGVEASLSTYGFKQVDRLDILKSTSDEFHLGKVGRITARNSKFTDINIDSLQLKASLHMRNGDLDIQNIGNGFTAVAISNSFSTIKIGGIASSDYSLFPQFTHTEVSIPPNLTQVGEGHYNKGKGGPTVRLDCDKCKVSIGE